MRRAVACVVLMVAAGACRSDNSTVATGSSSTTSTSTSASSTTSSTTLTFSGGGTTTVSTPVSAKQQLTDVRVGQQNGFDRIVFEFANSSQPPGYKVGYVDRPVQEDGSGKPVPVSGDSVLEIHMESASGVDLSGGKVTPTYTGPKRLTPGGTAVVDLTEAGDFEGVLRWVAGVKGHPAFKVSTLTGPTRLVVDVAGT